MSSVKRAFLILGVAYSILHLGYSVWAYNPLRYDVASNDVYQVYQRMNRWRQTGDFSQVGLKGEGVYYPSLYALLFLPLTNLPFKQVACLLYSLQFIFLPLAILCMVWAACPDRCPALKEFAMAGILAANYQPLLETVAKFKVEGMEVFLIALAVLAFRKGRDFLTGILLVLAMNLKYLPGILLGYFILKREVQVARAAAMAQGLVFWVVILFLGWGTFRTFTVQYPFRVLSDPATSYNWRVTRVAWQSLSGTIDRWFAAPVPPEDFLKGGGPISRPDLAKGVAVCLKGIFLALSLWVIRRRWPVFERRQRWPFYLLEISLALVMLVILIRGFAVHYGILLLPAFLFVGSVLIHRWGDFRWVEKGLFIVGYSLSATLLPGGLMRHLPAHPLWGQEYYSIYLWGSLPFFGYLLLFLCTLLCHHRLRKL